MSGTRVWSIFAESELVSREYQLRLAKSTTRYLPSRTCVDQLMLHQDTKLRPNLTKQTRTTPSQLAGPSSGHCHWVLADALRSCSPAQHSKVSGTCRLCTIKVKCQLRIPIHSPCSLSAVCSLNSCSSLTELCKSNALALEHHLS